MFKECFCNFHFIQIFIYNLKKRGAGGYAGKTNVFDAYG